MNQKSSFLLGFAALFLATAFSGLWAAYDQQQAFLRFVLLGTGLAVVFGAGLLSRQQRIQLAPTAALFVSLMVGGLAIYYLVKRESSHDAFSGILGSILALLLPLPLASCMQSVRGKKWIWVALFGLISLLGGLALLVTRERGAVLSLLVGGSVALLFWFLALQNLQSSVISSIRWMLWALGAITLVGYIAFVTSTSVATWVGEFLQIHPENDLFERRELWHDTLTLMGDYPFTGSGFASVPMALASYVYISHVANQPHVHNLFLQAGAEQGWLGLLAMLGMVLLAIVIAMEAIPARTRELHELRLGAIASTICLLVYGLLDAEIYAYSTVPLTFVPIAFALLVRSSSKRHQRKQATKGNITGRLVWIGASVLGLSFTIWWNGGALRSALFANLASVTQNKTELSVYDYRTWGVQDRLRHEPGGIQLEVVERYLQIALVLNRQNETALRRGAQIALARGDYTQAEEMLQTALRLAPEHRANRMLFGEVLAIRGQTNEAVQQWHTLSFLDDQLDARAWWYEQIQELQAAKNIRLAMAEITQ